MHLTTTGMMVFLKQPPKTCEMKNKDLIIKTAALALFFLAATLTSSAQRSAELLWSQFKNFAALNTVGTRSFDYDVLTKDKAGAEKHLGMTVLADGYKSRVEFTTPDDIKGTRFLYLDSNKIYCYLPAYGPRIRKIKPNAKQGLFGMAISNADLNILESLFFNYDASKTLNDDKASFELELMPKKDLVTPYAKIDIVIDNMNNRPLTIACFDSTGTKIRTFKFNNYTTEKDRYSASELVVVDLIGNLTTIFTRKSWGIDPQVSSSIFLKSSLSK